MFMAAIAGASLALSAFGAYQQYEGSQDQSAAMQAQLAAEARAERLRKKQMELEARRRTLETVRNQQRARSVALAASTNQGASAGSGLQGGYGQISGDAGNQLLATNQNLLIGRGLFGINQEISGYRSAYSQAGEDIALGRGLSSLGASLQGSAGQINSLAQGFGSTAASAPTYGGYYNLGQTGGHPFPMPRAY